MMHRILNSMNFVACLLAAATGIVLYFKQSFYRENVSLQVMALRVPLVHEGLFYSYNLFLFTTPNMAYSILLSGMYVFGLTVRLRIRQGKLPPYPGPEPAQRFISCSRRDSQQAQTYCFGNRSLAYAPGAGTRHRHAIVGAIATGKTSRCMYPFAEQILTYAPGLKS